ncbi:MULTISPECIES: hypothetical protein [Sphingosinicellaceae]|uniref:hypothetical protein n=1 Tax=Sphingosinicellaceae TaxID=2820280 RepID=UPI001C1DFA34|nr:MULTISPECIES: hypothetical protein [Polymorphobacter]QYE34967.1 hypothetical protein KZX46_19925 [Polymorphobacter sp. PAMC 29334]UAJ11680.1 hypothetical protein KTC28_08500 [Polymorphobacter megasporae]
MEPSQKPEEPIVQTTTESRAGSKTVANRNVMFISLAVVVIAFIALLLIYR